MKTKLSLYEKGYLEGIIDGEGTISVRKNKNIRYKCGFQFSVICCVSNTDLNLLKKVQKIIGSGSIVKHQEYSSEKNYKTAYRYQMPVTSMRILLPILEFTGKEKQCKLALEALFYLNGHKGLGKPLGERYEKKLNMIVIKIRKLNQRGIKNYSLPL